MIADRPAAIAEVVRQLGLGPAAAFATTFRAALQLGATPPIRVGVFELHELEDHYAVVDLAGGGAIVATSQPGHLPTDGRTGAVTTVRLTPDLRRRVDATGIGISEAVREGLELWLAAREGR